MRSTLVATASPKRQRKSPVLLGKVAVVAVEQIFERGQALERHALAGKLVGLGHRHLLLGEGVLDLFETEALGIGPKEQALETMVLDDRAEADDLHLAPRRYRAGEGVPGLPQRRRRRLLAEGRNFSLEAPAAAANAA